MNLLIIIPAHNEELNIAGTVSDIKANCPDTDFVVINDGSSDRTATICRENAYPMLNLPVNLGLTGAFLTGMRYAYEKEYDCAIQIDGDGQHDASYIPAILNKMEETGADIVIGSRFCAEDKPLTMRMLGSRLITAAIKITTGKTITDPTSGMRLYNRKMIKRFAKDAGLGPEPDTMAYLMRCGAEIEEQQVIMRERTAGESYLTAGKSIKYMLNMCMSIMFIQFFRGGRKK